MLMNNVKSYYIHRCTVHNTQVAELKQMLKCSHAINMALSNNVRYGMYIFLVIVLAWFTYSSIIKLCREDTVISQHYVEDGAKLPSVTICIGSGTLM